MKQEFEAEYKCALIENQMEERFGCEFMVLGRFKAEGVRIIARNVDAHIAAELLKAFPADQEKPLDPTARNPKGTVFGLYRLSAERGFTDQFTKLKVQWICNDQEYEFELRIDGSVLLEQFFVNDHRKMSRIECDTYKPIRRGHIVREMDLPIKRFLCNQIAYEGGHRSATEPERIQEIIDAIKEA